jgi:hypothetical protein
MGWSAPTSGWTRRAEATARIEALRALSYVDAPIDADGYPLRGPGTHARVFSAGDVARRDARRDEHLAAEAWAAARFDGGSDADGEADGDWVADWARRRGGQR